MTAAPEQHTCVNHPRAETAVACGKCGVYLCPRCMVFAPVGVRCRSCAQLRKLPQFDVKLQYMGVASAAALGAATLGWMLAVRVYFLAGLIAIGVGLAVGELASRLARRRVNRALEVAVQVNERAAGVRRRAGNGRLGHDGAGKGRRHGDTPGGGTAGQ